MRRAGLIYNPKSGRRRHSRVLDALLRTLKRAGFEVEPRPTGFPGEATGLARQLAAARADVVVAFGGDGTVREVAAGLLGSSTALAILPGGTMNLMALALGLPSDPVAAAAALERFEARPIDAGMAGDTPFLMMVSAGLDGRIFTALDDDLKWRLGPAAVVLQGMREWWRYSYPQIGIVADGEHLSATFCAVSNIPYHGGPFRIAPAANVDDGRLDLMAFHGTGRRATLSFVLDVIRGAATRRRDVTVRQVREVELLMPEAAAAQIDGDLCHEAAPLRVRLSPQPLLVMAPAPSG